MSESINTIAHQNWVDIAQLITAIAAVLIAAGAFRFSIREGRRNQERTELSLVPALAAHKNAYEHDPVLGHKIVNLGTGPGIIDAIYLVYGGVPVEVTNDVQWPHKIAPTLQKYGRLDLLRKFDGISFGPGGGTSGSVFGSPFELPIVEIRTDGLNHDALARHQEFVMDSWIVVFFRSFYGRRFVNIEKYNPAGNADSTLSPAEWISAHYPPPRPN
ncbi:MAG TPA: hypothetical protein VLV87_09045 [Gammaproteobacteria bacterium]|nr:hypothetical protein [Gammaproteobacteria bacterium]